MKIIITKGKIMNKILVYGATGDQGLPLIDELLKNEVSESNIANADANKDSNENNTAGNSSGKNNKGKNKNKKNLRKYLSFSQEKVFLIYLKMMKILKCP